MSLIFACESMRSLPLWTVRRREVAIRMWPCGMSGMPVRPAKNGPRPEVLPIRPKPLSACPCWPPAIVMTSKSYFEYLQSNVRLTHRDPFIAGRSVAFGLIVAALINGDTLKTAPEYHLRTGQSAWAFTERFIAGDNGGGQCGGFI